MEVLKDRIKLLLIIAGLLAFLFIFQNWFDTFWACIFILAFIGVYMCYCRLVDKHQRRKLKKNPTNEVSTYAPFISILIPCHNEENVIEKTIENILEVDYDKYEIIIIDDRSKDKTPEIVQRIADSNEKIQCLLRKDDAFPGKSAVLNDAMKLAKGEVVLVFDADAKIKPHFIKTILPKLEPADVAAVQAQKEVSNPRDNILTRFQYNELIYDTYVQIGRDAVRGAVELRGNGEIIKREALESIGGWNEHTITDDLDMSTRLHIKGWDIRFCPEAVVYEEAILTYGALIRQRKRWAEGSIRRYLEFAGDIFTSKDMSLRVGFDLIVYISEFLLPFWMVSEILIQSFRFYKGYENTIQSYWVPMLAAGIFFWMGLTHGLQKYSRYSGLKAVWMSFLTSIYMIVLWVPVVFYMVLKIVFTPKTMEWGKTEHKGNN